MGYPGQNVNYASSAKYGSVTAWAIGVAKTVGQMVRPSAPAIGNERVWLAYVAGTTNATTEPTWTTSRGDKIATDGTVSWIEVTGLPALNGDSANTPNWTNGAKAAVVNIGHIIQDDAGTHYFICTAGGGYSGSGAEPTWDTTALGNTTVDNSNTWTYIGLVSAFSTKWAAPHARLVLATNTNWMDNTAVHPVQRCFVGHDHAETTTGTDNSFPTHGTNNLSNGNSLDIVCVSTAGSMPPVSADLATTGGMTCTANNLYVGNGNYRWCYGLDFTVSGTSNYAIQLDGDNSDRFYEKCTFVLTTAVGAGGTITMGSAGCNHFKNCTFTFGNAGHSFNNIYNAEFDNCIFNGTAPTTNGLLVSPFRSRAIFRNCDFSAWTSMPFRLGNTTGGSTFIFRDCIMPSGWTPGDVIENGVVSSSDVLVFSRCNISGTPNAWQFWQNDEAANIQADAAIARATGAQDAGTHISWKVVTKANVTMNSSDTKPPMIAEWNDTLSTITATIYGIVNAAALPTNDYCFMDVDYLGTSGDTLGVRVSSRIADYLATPAALTANTSDWTAGSVAARANSTAYVVGNVIKLASNAGRLFFCTTAGTTASSEPGGYSTAVDGGSVTDGTATFRAGMRFSMSVTLTSPQVAGNVYAQIRFGAPSTTIYFDPLLIL